MEGLERGFISNNWVIMLFVFGLLLIFFLKLFKAAKLRGYAASVFNKGFIEIESQEKTPPITFFHSVFTLFSFLSISMTVYFLFTGYREELNTDFFEYVKWAFYILIYILGRFLVEFVLMSLLQIKSLLSYFILSKRSYLYSISIGLFLLNFIYFYGYRSQIFLLIGTIILFGMRLLLILNNNKNLIIKELFYFILYICAFEIAPLLILFKLIF
ncbi:MAG: DUF4271 domain-containing protein [Flavobacteriaceae bacterium]|nr:DUF4271 domain-containing protein [Flavobacteriaceae bacterium]